jgi:PQQ-dependent dehydrogenase (methanol/ethanol family)
MTSTRLITVLAVIVLGITAIAFGFDDKPTAQELIKSDKNHWLHYHGNYAAWRFSELDQINKSNARNLVPVCVFQPGGNAIEEGLEATPIVYDGVMYLSTSWNRVYALDGSNCEVIWSYFYKYPKEINTFFIPYNRGVAIGDGKVFMGTIDGYLVALNMKDGKEIWKTQVDDWTTNGNNITGAPLVVKDKVITGTTGGELPIRGFIAAYNINDGKEAWRFYTIPDKDKNEKGSDTWGGDTWKTGGGGSWLTGSYDPELNLTYWGVANPAPAYDWGEARPGDNLYTSSILALNPDNGELKWYFQEVPHDPWDFDSTWESVLIDTRDGKKLLVHQNKGGWVNVLDRIDGKYITGFAAIDNLDWFKGVDAKGRIQNVRTPKLDEDIFNCPATAGGRSWNAGAYNPKTGIWFNHGNEWCQVTKVRKETPVTVPQAQTYFGADFEFKPPPDGKAYGHTDAYDPVTGKRKWRHEEKYPTLGSFLATAGGLLVYGNAEGHAKAIDQDNGKVLWSFNMGSGSRGGTISYAVKGTQYIAIPSGWGSKISSAYPALWPETEAWKPSAALFVFGLKK